MLSSVSRIAQLFIALFLGLLILLAGAVWLDAVMQLGAGSGGFAQEAFLLGLTLTLAVLLGVVYLRLAVVRELAELKAQTQAVAQAVKALGEDHGG